ncbi:ATP-dependent nuclease [Sandaracinus amylolyticus]|uniref:AAA+ ATPase domain-containing protein n=1 Tax=Sandaracinus amylolyticus TaxID=927083 RepID=A0A0F6YKM7_9BACT|nr:AAA family ATPase [Sandaracinus amylolyticus]AKF08976.1 hypothetical protein DB32_006125 [Sandaracinus amylolyticus]
MNALSKEMRLLAKSWTNSVEWPKRLEWLEISGIRGWTGQRVEFAFPITAICGENGMGKSTVLQAAVSSYRSKSGAETYFASQFFPDTAWEKIKDASIKYSVREGTHVTEGRVRKPTSRWLGNRDRRMRTVRYLDLRRTQPFVAQRGYQKLVKNGVSEAGSSAFEGTTVARLSSILGRTYSVAKRSWTNVDHKLMMSVLQDQNAAYSGFHQGAGEVTVAELLTLDFPEHSLVAIDEVETSLHPRAQRRLIRDLAEVARLRHVQVLLTTHSPYIVEELPPEARLYVAGGSAGRSVIRGISADFALTKMDEDAHPEGEIFVEDAEGERLVREALVIEDEDLARRVQIVKAGASSVVKALGIMVKKKSFPRPCAAIVDGDVGAADGCIVLPGGDAPERVVFAGLKQIGFPDVAMAVGRSHSELVDALENAMTLPDHHDWLQSAGDTVLLGKMELWNAMVRVWLKKCVPAADRAQLVQAIQDTLQLP